MGKKYSHLSLEERERMYALKVAGLSLRQISLSLGRSHTSLSRELRRNAPYLQEYIPVRAERRAFKKGLKQRYQAPLKCPLVWLYVREKLRLKWSPETIAGRLKIDHPGYSIDDDTIYRYIYKSSVKPERLYEYLTLHRRRRLKKHGRKVKGEPKIVGAVSIDKRPKSVSKRVTPGHWETDNMRGVITDRREVSATAERLTRVTLLSLLEDKTAAVKTEATVKRLKEFPKSFRKTLTADNGPENSKHQELSKELNLKVYFCHPYHSWEKGTVENTIGRLRRFLPKGMSLKDLKEEDLQRIEHLMNSTPRKCLGYLTPYEKLGQYIKSFKSRI